MTESIAWLSIVGINENGLDGLSADARAAISSATHVYGGKRHFKIVSGLITGETHPWPSPPHLAIAEIISRKPERICVLTSGDPFNHGMGAVLARHIAPAEMHVIPAPSIFSLVAARTGWAIQQIVPVALNGRPLERLIPHFQPAARIVVLCADETTPPKIAALMTQRGLGDSEITLFERTGGPQERMRKSKASAFAFTDIDRLNCLAIEIPASLRAKCLPTTSGLADDYFEHDGQLTKREIRAVTLSALAMRRGELLWDIGLGAGSVAIEWLLRDPANRAIGFEKNTERAHRSARNAKTLGVPQLVVLEGDAPSVLEGLDAPDAIFIGGGGAATGVLDAAWNALKSGGRLVMNAVSLETEALLLTAHKRYGGELIRIGIERADAVSANMTGWRPAMTVTQWSVSK
jgi:precorrin-6Y C5,15-methyltransferase (decarboxylating)